MIERVGNAATDTRLTLRRGPGPSGPVTEEVGVLVRGQENEWFFLPEPEVEFSFEDLYDIRALMRECQQVRSNAIRETVSNASAQVVKQLKQARLAQSGDDDDVLG